MTPAAVLERQGLPDEAAEIRRRLAPKPDPLKRRQQALEQYKSGDCAGAAAKFQELLDERFALPDTHCHMARALLMLDREAEAHEHVAQAWQHRDQAEPYIVARIRCFEVLCALLDGENPSTAIATLKRTTAAGNAHMEWIMEPVLDHLVPRLSLDDLAFHRALVNALSDAANLAALDQFQQWREAGS